MKEKHKTESLFCRLKPTVTQHANLAQEMNMSRCPPFRHPTKMYATMQCRRQNHNGSTIANHTPSRARNHEHGDASKVETDFCDTRAKQPRADTMSMIARHRRETKESQQLEPRAKLGNKKQHKNTNHKMSKQTLVSALFFAMNAVSAAGIA